MNNPVEGSGRVGASADFDAIMAAIGKAPKLAPALAALALAEVRRGVMTGEGPTTRGRVHFSRTIDGEDAALCARILIAAGKAAGQPVSREEVEVLIQIHAAARDREDGGCFEDLLSKAIAHHVLAAAGRAVPPREVALCVTTPLASWAASASVDAAAPTIAAWLAAWARGGGRADRLLDPAIALLIGAGAAPAPMSLASLLDWAA